MLFMELHDLRINYGKGEIRDSLALEDPLAWFGDWLAEAISSGVNEANAMVLSTVSNMNRPSSRVVLLKDFDSRGFLFFTNYESKKGNHLTVNPAASLLFFWPEMERQVRIEGYVNKAEAEISDEYFYSRPIESRVSAAISPQSHVISSRTQLEQIHQEFLNTYSDGTFLRPVYWGGYWLLPDLIEFWQGRRNRLHDRVQFKRNGEGWEKSRLAP
jgi:pyridoxamine 5'-phosphate oxidase